MMKRYIVPPELKEKRDRFIRQKRQAKNRGIPWYFTFEEWVDWWGDDFEKRGGGGNDLCMARFGDVGPYHPSNVRKATMNENNSEGHKGKSRVFSDEHRKKLSEVQRGKPFTEKRKKAISEAKKAYHARKKETQS